MPEFHAYFDFCIWLDDTPVHTHTSTNMKIITDHIYSNGRRWSRPPWILARASILGLDWPTTQLLFPSDGFQKNRGFVWWKNVCFPNFPRLEMKEDWSTPTHSPRNEMLSVQVNCVYCVHCILREYKNIFKSNQQYHIAVTWRKEGTMTTSTHHTPHHDTWHHKAPCKGNDNTTAYLRLSTLLETTWLSL